MRRRTLLSLAIAALVSVAGSSVALATTLARLDLEALTAQSELVVHGTVTRLAPEVRGGRVFTNITLEVTEALKGTPGDSVTFTQLGGRTRNLATRVAGMPDFRLGEEVLVFLERPSVDAPLVVTGMAQGKFTVHRDVDGQAAYLEPEAMREHLIDVLPYPETPSARPRLRPTTPSPIHIQVSDFTEVTARIRSLTKARR
ncbi:MAG: hypothetical protein AAGI01_09140 [Myxococcota bacterium]